MAASFKASVSNLSITVSVSGVSSGTSIWYFIRLASDTSDITVSKTTTKQSMTFDSSDGLLANTRYAVNVQVDGSWVGAQYVTTGEEMVSEDPPYIKDATVTNNNMSPYVDVSISNSDAYLFYVLVVYDGTVLASSSAFSRTSVSTTLYPDFSDYDPGTYRCTVALTDSTSWRRATVYDSTTVTFKTTIDAPTVALRVTDYTATTASLEIYASSRGYTIEPTTWSYRLSTASTYTTLDDAYGGSEYTLTGLTHNTSYVVRVYYKWSYGDHTDSSGAYEQTSFTTSKLARTYFSWQNGIVSSAPTESCPFSDGDAISTWVTAKRWGQLQENVQLVQELKGKTPSTFTEVSKGDAITAALFNELVKAITGMNGYSYSDYAATAGSTQIKAEYIWRLQTSINNISTS